MPFAPARLAALLLVVALASCGDDATPSSPAVTSVVEGEADAGAIDPARCADLDECTCGQTPGCVPLTTDCWCPPDSCGAGATCACSGGRFLGCNPAPPVCPHVQCALFAEPSVRDAHGCLKCADPTECSTAIGKLPSICPGMVAADAQWICAGAYDPCAGFCVASLRSCEAAACALCPDCSCGDDLFTSCLVECLSVAQDRHHAAP